MRKTNAVLLVLVIAALAFVTIYERFTLSTGETADRSSRVMPDLVRDRLGSISVERGAEHYVLTRGPRDADGNPTFQFSHTQAGSVDGQRVLAALSAIEWAEPMRTLSGASEADRRRHGLDRPRLLLRFEVASESMTLAFGADEPTSGGIYADADGKVLVVGREAFEAFDHDSSFFRVRRFASELPEAPSILTVKTARADVRLVRDGSRWRMERPYEATASEGRVNVVLSFLRTLEATRFVEERPVDLARYGLAQPSMVVTVGDESVPDAARLVVGTACEGDADARFARFGEGPIVCVASDDLDPLDADARAYLELRALSTEAGEMKSLDLANGRSTLSVVDEDGSFRFRLGEENGLASTDALAEWLETLRSTRAVGIDRLPRDFAPTVTLTVHRTGTRPDEVIRFDVAGDAGVTARRGDDAIVLRFAPVLRDRISVTSMHLQDLGLIREDPGNLREIRIERGSSTEVLRQSSEGGLSIVEPVQVPADSTRLGDLAARLAGLEAVRFVSAAPRPSHGLASPRIVVYFSFGRTASEVTTHRLRIGAPGDGQSSFAQLDDSQVVFALVDATVELVATPLASRERLATEAGFMEQLQIRSGTRTVRMVREGPHFRLGSAALDDAQANAALRALAELRPVEVAAYEASSSSLGLERPSAEIRIERTADAPEPHVFVLQLGAERGEGESRLRAVRRADSPVVYWVRFDSLEPVLSLLR